MSWSRRETEKAFFPWFYKLMKNLCLDYLRKKKKRSEVPLEGTEASQDERQNAEIREALGKAIAKLPFEQREVIILRYFQQLSYRELSEMTGKPIGSVMSSLYYAKRKLKEIVAKYLGSEQENLR